jgi:two-component system, NarL family, nitrate/nitrite response regulator NarL
MIVLRALESNTQGIPYYGLSRLEATMRPAEGFVMHDADRRNESPIVVAVADSTSIYSQLLADALKRDHRIQVAAAVSTARELFEIASKRLLHVAVINWNLDEEPSRGFEALRELRLSQPAVRGIILLDSPKREMVVEAFQVGASGVFSKQESLRNFCKCVRRVHEGQIWANSRDLTLAMEALASSRHSIRSTDSKGIAQLSRRELEVVQALAEGLTNRDIGERLRISKHTVKNYLLRIFDKVGVSSRMELLFLTLSSTRPAAASEAPQEAGLARHYEAAQQGVSEAQFKLAKFYQDGVGIPQDSVLAYMWCLLSERANLDAHEQIRALKARIAESMNAEQISAAERQATEWSSNFSLKKPPASIAPRSTENSPERPATTQVGIEKSAAACLKRGGGRNSASA